MNRRKFALALAAGATQLRAETAKERGKLLVDRVVEGLGGSAFRDMQTHTEVGRAYSFYHEKLNGLSIAHLYTKYLQPDKTPDGIFQLQRQALGKRQDDVVLFTTNEGYEVTFRGAKPLPDDQVKRYQETTLHDIFYILRARFNEPGIEFESSGADVVENQSVQKLEVFDSENRQITVWVNSTTFLPAKQRFYRWDPVINARREEVTRYSKYRDIGSGIMWPFATERERDTEKIYQMFSEQVTANDSMADSLFELPNGIKMLKK
jgi:hypothetical protein